MCVCVGVIYGVVIFIVRISNKSINIMGTEKKEKRNKGQINVIKETGNDQCEWGWTEI